MTDTFASLQLNSPLLAAIGEIGFETPTPIQAKTIPLLLQGRDVIGQSRTGSGKSAAFSLPILQNLDLDQRAPQALVICPTRELCAQVAADIRSLGRRLPGLVVVTLTGGEPSAHQRSALENGVHIVVGTPGRLLDHVERGTLQPEKIRYAVLDEADRMLEMGFLDDVEKILHELSPNRQTALFSATFPGPIESISRTHQRDAIRVTVAEENLEGEIRHLLHEAAPTEKRESLRWLLSTQEHESALVFCNFKATVAELTEHLGREGASVDCIHGDLTQFERDQVLARFRNRSVRILVATDVASRGLDVKDLDLVINYELPMQPEIYVHRAGRTGRAGNHGIAISLHTEREHAKLDDIRDAGFLFATYEPGSEDVDRLRRPAMMSTILISGGRKDKVRPGDILGALTGEAGGLRGDQVGKIEVRDRLTYVAVHRDVARRATEAINKGRIKKRRFRASLVGSKTDRRGRK